MKVWKALGLAGLAGVAATGVIIARDERKRAQMTPEDVRTRLRQRYAEAAAEPEPAPEPPPSDRPGCLPSFRGVRRRAG